MHDNKNLYYYTSILVCAILLIISWRITKTHQPIGSTLLEIQESLHWIQIANVIFIAAMIILGLALLVCFIDLLRFKKY